MVKLFRYLLDKAIEHILYLIVAFTLGGIATIAIFNKWLSSKILAVFNWLGESGSYANWLVTLFGLLLAGSIAWLLVILFRHIKSGKLPKWYGYTTDTFWNVKWTWKYGNVFDYHDVYDLRAICPKCNGDVRLIKEYNSLDACCMVCNANLYRVNNDVSLHQFKEAVKGKIRQQVRQRFGVD